MADEWLSLKDAAELTGYSTRQLLRLIHAEKIKADKFVDVWRIDRRSVLAYVKEAGKTGKKRGPKTGA